MTFAGTRKERRLLIDDILYYTLFLMHMQLYTISFIGCFISFRFSQKASLPVQTTSLYLLTLQLNFSTRKRPSISFTSLRQRHDSLLHVHFQTLTENCSLLHYSYSHMTIITYIGPLIIRIQILQSKNKGYGQPRFCISPTVH